jgi:hypothetical protein
MEGNFTNARRFQLPDGFDDALFSDRICPKNRPRVADASEHCGADYGREQKEIVLRDYLGYSADCIASLESADVLHRGDR